MESILQLNSRPNSASPTERWVALMVLFKQNLFNCLLNEGAGGGGGKKKRKEGTEKCLSTEWS